MDTNTLGWIVILGIVLVVVAVIWFGRSGSTPSPSAAGVSSAPSRAGGPACPLCDRNLPGDMNGNRNHFARHVVEVGPNGLPGHYTFACRRCGPAGTQWKSIDAAATGLLVHMDQRHGIRMG